MTVRQTTTKMVSVKYVFNPILVIPIACIGAIVAIAGTSVCIWVLLNGKKNDRVSADPERADHDDVFTPVVVVDSPSALVPV